MTYADWRKQFGNPLGLIHDGISHRLMRKNIKLLSAEGMKGASGAVTAWPVLCSGLDKIRPNRLIGNDGKPMELVVSAYIKVGGITQLFGEEVDHASVTYSKRGALRYNGAILPGARSYSLSYYYRNREKVRAYQQARRARMKS